MEVQVVRSPRRKMTVSAVMRGDVLEVRLPTGLTPAQEQEYIDRLRQRLEKRKVAKDANKDGTLRQRADQFNQRYFQGKLRIASIAWVSNQNSLYGSCSSRTGEIRLAHQLLELPQWVQDYVLMHELAHLVHPDHSAAFWRVVNRYPYTERARGYLIAKGRLTDDTGEV